MHTFLELDKPTIVACDTRFNWIISWLTHCLFTRKKTAKIQLELFISFSNRNFVGLIQTWLRHFIVYAHLIDLMFWCYIKNQVLHSFYPATTSELTKPNILNFFNLRVFILNNISYQNFALVPWHLFQIGDWTLHSNIMSIWCWLISHRNAYVFHVSWTEPVRFLSVLRQLTNEKGMS